jgi:hypothetical protein
MRPSDSRRKPHQIMPAANLRLVARPPGQSAQSLITPRPWAGSYGKSQRRNSGFWKIVICKRTTSWRQQSLRDPPVGLTGKYALHLVDVAGPNFLTDLLLALALSGQLTDGNDLCGYQHVVTSSEHLEVELVIAP